MRAVDRYAAHCVRHRIEPDSEAAHRRAIIVERRASYQITKRAAPAVDVDKERGRQIIKGLMQLIQLIKKRVAGSPLELRELEAARRELWAHYGDPHADHAQIAVDTLTRLRPIIIVHRPSLAP